MLIINSNLPHRLAYQITQTSTALPQNPQAQHLHPDNCNKIYNQEYQKQMYVSELSSLERYNIKNPTFQPLRYMRKIQEKNCKSLVFSVVIIYKQLV